MRKNKFIILGLLVITVLFFGSKLVLAQNQPVLIVSPANLTKEVGKSFNLIVKVQPNGKEVCAVEGQLILSNLMPQKVELAKDIISQTPPSFSNRFYFLLGIPRCTVQDKTLFTIKIKASTIGKAKASFKKVDIIGRGVSISQNSRGGNYTIITPVIDQSGKKKESSTKEFSCACTNWSSWENKGCGEESCLDTQMLQIRTRTCNPIGCDITIQGQCVNSPQCISKAKESSSIINKKENVKEKSLLASIGNIFSFGTGNILVEILVIILILTAIIYLLWFLLRRRKKSS